MSDAGTANSRIVSMTEQETARGWQYTVELQGAKALTEHVLTLSWVDHDYWCGGCAAPSETLRRVIDAFSRSPLPVPTKADCSTLRRLYPRLDDVMGATVVRGRAAA